MSDSVQPNRLQPTRLPYPWDSPGKNTGVGCHFLLQHMKVKSQSEVTQSYPTLSDPWTAAYQAPLSMGFSRQEYWSGLPLPSPAEFSTVSLIPLQATMTSFLQLPNWSIHTFLVHCFLGHSQHSSESNLFIKKILSKVDRYTLPYVK